MMVTILDDLWQVKDWATASILILFELLVLFNHGILLEQLQELEVDSTVLY